MTGERKTVSYGKRPDAPRSETVVAARSETVVAPQRGALGGSLSTQPEATPRPAALPTGVAGLETLAAFGAGTTSALKTAVRAYADGVLVTSTAEEIHDPARIDAEEAVPLPYASSAVVMRIGPYDVLRELGRGGMGVVYEAYSLRLCRPCAIKVMLANHFVGPVQLVRFQNEAMLAARLTHPNIVQVFDAGEADGQFYFVMEYVPGKPLQELAGEPDTSTETLVRVAAKVARALDYAHQRGIIHRDIKPDNILVDAALEPHVTDFGIAANVQTEKRLTHEGALMGTPPYMSPEQINGELARIGPSTDVYALGATLFTVLCGRDPFVADSIVELFDRVLHSEAPRPSAVAAAHSRREIPIDLETICLKALEKQASHRYPSAGALADDLEAFLEGRPVQARPISAVERLQKLIRRKREAFVVATVVFSTLLVVGLAFGVVTVSNIERTSETLREQDEQAGLEQAATLERAIRVNMLQGRADVVRDLVGKLREDPLARSIDVVRPDRTFAYTDLSTRKRVERRLEDPRVLAEIEAENPEFLDKVAEVKRLAFGNIDASRRADRGLFDYDRNAWSRIAEQLAPHTERSVLDGEPVLTIFKPIENSEDCQICHGGPGEGIYGDNLVRAVLVVRRSQQRIEDRIARNRQMALGVGLATAGTIVALLWGFATLFGIRLRRQRYSA